MRWFLTARGGAILAEQAPLPPANESDVHLPRVRVDPARRFQTIEGFGGAFTEAAAVTWLKLDEARRAALNRPES